MLDGLRKKIAEALAPEHFNAVAKKQQDMDMLVNQRVAENLLKMDPFEPLLKKYHVIFSEEYDKPEDKLNEPGQLGLFMWAYGMKGEPHFKHLIDWIRNTQGNATLRRAQNDHEWLYGRAAVATMTLFTAEVSRLAGRYEDILAKRKEQGGFDEHLAAE